MICMITSKDIKYFRAAENVSTLSDFHSVHIGSVLVYKHRIISDGYNTNKESVLQKYYDKYRNLYGDNIQHKIHSESMCIQRIKDCKDVDWNKVSIYIFRQHKNGIRALAKPCASCKQLLIDMGIKDIYFTGENSFCEEKIE